VRFAIGIAVVIAVGGLALAPAAHGDERARVARDGKAKERAWLGVSIRIGSHGVLVDEVIPRTPAEDAGIAVGDQIIAADGQKVSTPGELTALLGRRSVGDAIGVSVWRDGESRSLSCMLARHLSEEEIFERRWIDQPAPAFDLDVATGSEPGRLSALRGDVVVLAVLGREPCCGDTLARLSKLARARAGSGLHLLGVMQRERRQLAELASEQQIDLTLLSDLKDELRDTYLRGARLAEPLWLVIDRDGIVRFAGVGERVGEIEAAVATALRERNGIELE